MGLRGKRRAKEQLEMEFDRLYRENKQKVFSLAWRLTGDEDAAEDIGQKTFLTLHIKLNEVLSHPAPEGWLIETVHYYVKHYKREQAYRAQREVDIEAADRIPAPQPFNELNDFLDALPGWVQGSEKDMLTLYYYYQYSLREISNMLGVTYGALRTRMVRLHNKLREHWFDKTD